MIRLTLPPHFHCPARGNESEEATNYGVSLEMIEAGHL